MTSSVLHLKRIILSEVRVGEWGNRTIGGMQAKGGSGRVSETGPMYFWIYFEGRAGGVSQMRKQPF